MRALIFPLSLMDDGEGVQRESTLTLRLSLWIYSEHINKQNYLTLAADVLEEFIIIRNRLYTYVKNIFTFVLYFRILFISQRGSICECIALINRNLIQHSILFLLPCAHISKSKYQINNVETIILYVITSFLFIF